MDPGVKLREFLPLEKGAPQNRTCTLLEKIQNFVSELLLVVEKKKLRNCQACFVRRAIAFLVCPHFSSTACIRVTL